MKKKTKEFQLNVEIMTNRDTDTYWSLTVKVNKSVKLTPYELSTIAKEGAKKALNKIKGVKAGLDCH